MGKDGRLKSAHRLYPFLFPPEPSFSQTPRVLFSRFLSNFLTVATISELGKSYDDKHSRVHTPVILACIFHLPLQLASLLKPLSLMIRNREERGALAMSLAKV